MQVTVQVNGLETLQDEIDAMIDADAQAFASILLEELIQTTPLLTGQAASNWQVSVASPHAEFISLVRGSPKPLEFAGEVDRALTVGLETIKAWSLSSGVPLYIQNEAPYIVRLNEGYSGQAPAGFVEIAVNYALQAAK